MISCFCSWGVRAQPLNFDTPIKIHSELLRSTSSATQFHFRKWHNGYLRHSRICNGSSVQSSTNRSSRG